MPAKAGIQEFGIIQSRSERDWIPAFAGMTAFSRVTTQSLMGEGEGEGDLGDYFRASGGEGGFPHLAERTVKT